MNSIKKDFTIKDLENISGIKAHTIRIWEKRYGLLQPKRTDTNIRYYSHQNLQKLLNIVLLNKNNFKISKIAEMSDEAIILNSRELAFKIAVNDEAINSFKLAMFQFDKVLFNNTYNKLLHKKTFREIFKDVFMPFLEHIGLLWQTDTLLPAHEHFISNLISQKIQINTEKLQYNVTNSGKTYVLFLPENEIHEWLLNMQKQDILKVQTEENYWEDIPQTLFELLKTNIKNKKYEHTMAKGHLWLEMEISLEPEPDEES